MEEYIKNNSDTFYLLKRLKPFEDKINPQKLLDYIIKHKNSLALLNFFEIFDAFDPNPYLVHTLLECPKHKLSDLVRSLLKNDKINNSLFLNTIMQLHTLNAELLSHMLILTKWTPEDEEIIFNKIAELSSAWAIVSLETITHTIKCLNTKLKLEPLLKSIIKRFSDNWDWDGLEQSINLIVVTYASKFGSLYPDDINLILDKAISSAVNVNVIKHLNLTAENIIDFLIKNNRKDSHIIDSMINDSIITDSKIINKYLLHFKEAELATKIILEHMNIVNDNYLFIQTIIEKFGTEEDVLRSTNSTIKDVNIATLKKRYNVILTKKIKEDPNILNGIERYFNNYISMRSSNKAKSLLNDNNNDMHENYELHANDCKEYGDFLKQKNDWFGLSKKELGKVLNNPMVIAYKIAKNKTFTQMYNESFKNDYKSITSLYSVIMGDYVTDLYYLIEATDLLNAIIEKSYSFSEYVKYCVKLKIAAKIYHNMFIDKKILSLAVLNKSFDMENPLNEDFLETLKNISNTLNINVLKSDINSEASFYINIAKQINEKTKKETININDFIENISIISKIIDKFKLMQPILWQRNSEEYNAFIKFHNEISLIEQFENLQEYISDAKPKDNFFKNLNININNFNFTVLDFLDPYAFKVGADTNCCQRIGGAGEMAAIDSFINPEAGVLLLKKDNMLLSQSYFHYVPSENGIILDNIEVNDDNLKRLNINNTMLSKIYANYAAALKEKMPELNYIKCGMNYNKIDNNLFGKSKMEEDPRHFEVDDPYSDFDEDLHLDLLKPSEQLKNIVVMAKNLVSLSKKQIIKVSDVRRILLTKLALNN